MATNNASAAENTEPAPALESQSNQDDAAPAPPTLPEAQLPTKKDTSLREFLGKMDDYAPIVRPTPSAPASSLMPPGSSR